MAVGTEQDAGLRPTAPNAADEAAQMGAHFHAGGRLARPQDDRDGAAPGGVIDVDRQEAARRNAQHPTSGSHIFCVLYETWL